MENKELEAALKTKLEHLTFEGARLFWNEICEYLDSIVDKCDGKLRKLDTSDLDIRKAQILRDICLRLKPLPEKMVLSIKAQVAAESSGAKIEEMEVLNFFRPSDVKQEE